MTRSAPVGFVIGTEDAFALDFWVWIARGQYLQLDDVVTIPIELPDGSQVTIHGVVDTVRSRFEGAQYDSDAEKVRENIIPAGIANAAHVVVTRVEPEVYVAPFPGSAVYRSEGDDRNQALYFDTMVAAGKAFTAGFSRDNQQILGNLEFLDGTRGAHINISGISGVATKTSYALFLLYSLFHSGILGETGHATKAVVFNVKGEDLLWLDKPNRRLDPNSRLRYEAAGLPVGPFQSVGIWAPPREDPAVIMPDVQTRHEGVATYCWSLKDFCDERLLRFLFAEADNETSQLSFVIRLVEEWLTKDDVVSEPDGKGHITINGATVRTFRDLCEQIEANLDSVAGRAVAGTQGAFLRRLISASQTAGHLIRAVPPQQADDHRIRVSDGGGAAGNRQITVIDINNLGDRAKRFVVGVVIQRLVEQKKQRLPLTFLVLDELNKYAPREGWSPIKEVLLDIAERGRSLGLILIGAQQTASEVERRITANAAFRVAGRLDAAEAARNEHGFLTDSARARASILKPGTMFLTQPEIPVPLLTQFPFPAWATRADEVDHTPTPDTKPAGLRGGLLR